MGGENVLIENDDLYMVTLRKDEKIIRTYTCHTQITMDYLKKIANNQGWKRFRVRDDTHLQCLMYPSDFPTLSNVSMTEVTTSMMELLLGCKLVDG